MNETDNFSLLIDPSVWDSLISVEDAYAYLMETYEPDDTGVHLWILAWGVDEFSRNPRSKSFVFSPHRGGSILSTLPRLTARDRWSGLGGVGNLDAWQSMERAIVLARTRGAGCVALAHTNHWMRGAAYGWQAAEAGVIGICWTNTMPNLPPWGSSIPLLGNNPAC